MSSTIPLCSCVAYKLLLPEAAAVKNTLPALLPYTGYPSILSCSMFQQLQRDFHEIRAMLDRVIAEACGCSAFVWFSLCVYRLLECCTVNFR